MREENEIVNLINSVAFEMLKGAFKMLKDAFTVTSNKRVKSV
jgi:hypothetical protein